MFEIHPCYFQSTTRSPRTIELHLCVGGNPTGLGAGRWHLGATCTAAGCATSGPGTTRARPYYVIIIRNMPANTNFFSRAESHRRGNETQSAFTFGSGPSVGPAGPACSRRRMKSSKDKRSFVSDSRVSGAACQMRFASASRTRAEGVRDAREAWWRDRIQAWKGVLNATSRAAGGTFRVNRRLEQFSRHPRGASEPPLVRSAESSTNGEMLA